MQSLFLFLGTDELDEFNESPHVVHSSNDGSMTPLYTHSDGSDSMRENLIIDNVDEDEVLFTALQMNHNNHKISSNNSYG